MRMKTFCLALALLLGTSACLGADAPHHKPASAAKPAEQETSFDDLTSHVGDHVTVSTTFGTVRAGILLKRSNYEITLKLDDGAEFSVPRDTIRKITVRVPAPETQSATGDGSAKKN
ncbi:MAG TPA: hypothetical protein VFB32_16995 [Rudaea sp.]|nr:hypothetical protein [Rudaea sp.]